MNRDDAREFAKLMQAYADGNEIQLYTPDLGWQDLKEPEFFARSPISYRVKPEPRKPREAWVKYEEGRPTWVTDANNKAAADSHSNDFAYVLMREVTP